MPSRTEDAAVPHERAFRALGVAAIVALGVRLGLASPSASALTRVTTTGLATSLARVTQVNTPGVHLDATRALAADERDWLRALDRAGSHVTWTASRSLPPLALQAEPVVAPGGRSAMVMVVSPRAPVAVRDAVGLVDSLRAGKEGIVSLVASIRGGLRVSTVAGEAAIPSLDTAILRAVLVVGPAGWESKYIVAALEESGWPVEVRLSVAPNVYVGVGRPVSLDTSQYAAVVVLDSLAFRIADIARYLRSGGGVVLAAGGAANAALASLAGVVPGERLRGELGALASSDARRGLSAVGFRVRDERSTVLERRGPAAVAVARRTGAGRVLALGADETWRWRMQGADGSVEAHRTWWSSAVARVAYAPVPNVPFLHGLDAMPLAAMHAALGPPTSAPRLTSRVSTSMADALLLVIVLLSLLCEWGSRRLRGAP